MAAAFPYPSMRGSFDLRFYFVVGPDDCAGRTLLDVVAKALDGGASFIQLRAKHADVAQIVSMAEAIAHEIRGHHLEHTVAFVIDDRVDAALEARHRGIKVDGVHIGQQDLSPLEARRLLGNDAIIGLSAKTLDEVMAANALPAGTIDYLGAGPLHETATKPDCIVTHADGTTGTQSAQSINALCEASLYPLVVGGGVHVQDVPMLASTHADGWFVVSAIAAAGDPEQATQDLVNAWLAVRGDTRHGYAQHVADTHTLPAALTIATTDSSGGAGIAADLKTMLANDVYGMCVVAGITAQNTTGVQLIAPVDAPVVRAQIDSVFTDIRPAAVKIGVIVGDEQIETVAAALRDHSAGNVVVDPVMVATSGSSLADSSAIRTMMRELFPLAALITPNIPEAQALAGADIASRADMERAARTLAGRFGCAVLVKGGHGIQDANDVLALPNGDTRWFPGERIGNPNTHGTGCTLSSAIAAHLALGEPLDEAIAHAKAYVSGALRAMLDLGAGSGPMDHGWAQH
ncbi:bifunctional hydroxymethylpyrimidine kinase/phosphomethylpyrimidine kinase [Bifidobacterium pseudolongum]|uniref:bifunctional hydroxymethylpyrimidine kinase/phosphomethylpyrimidine kinase n=1 Tax=Bifidobacterium pseudolongum TaxID=1694 RepID=UPI003F91981A